MTFINSCFPCFKSNKHTETGGYPPAVKKPTEEQPLITNNAESINTPNNFPFNNTFSRKTQQYLEGIAKKTDVLLQQINTNEVTIDPQIGEDECYGIIFNKETEEITKFDYNSQANIFGILLNAPNKTAFDEIKKAAASSLVKLPDNFQTSKETYTYNGSSEADRIICEALGRSKTDWSATMIRNMNKNHWLHQIISRMNYTK